MSRPPSIDVLAHRASSAAPGLPHPLCVDAAREAVASGDPDRVEALAVARLRALLGPVVNATGVILHTNLGRAPLPVNMPGGYSNLEFDLATGGRGSRSAHTATLIARATGAEAALVVNNGAAAVMLVLAALASGRRVVVSRGELVEIGGGFRIPDVLRSSGAELVEVGTTNRTRLRDYLGAVEPERPALFLKVHPSNYRMTGFTESVDVRALAHAAGVLGEPAVAVVADLGSGLLDARCPWLPSGPPEWLAEPLAAEPAARQTLEAGAAVVTFSGDKLLGGPQAGIIAGRADIVEACARHPLARALRPGGLVLGALQAVVLAYLRRDVEGAVPLWRMLTASPDELRARAAALGAGTVVPSVSVTGGGTLPGAELPSFGVAVAGDHAGALRAWDPPVIARVADGQTVCDLRTVHPDEDEIVAKAVASLGAGSSAAQTAPR